ncbi:putative protein isoform X1 [Capsicum annuum]
MEPEFDLSKEVLQTIPIWVKFPNLSLNCLGMQSLSKIGSELGVPLYVNACTTAVDRISYAHVLVEMDITKDLPKKIKVEDPTGRIFGQPIKYEWVPLHCPICLNIGHKCQAKEDNVAKPKGIHGIQKVVWHTKQGQETKDA